MPVLVDKRSQSSSSSISRHEFPALFDETILEFLDGFRVAHTYDHQAA